MISIYQYALEFIREYISKLLYKLKSEYAIHNSFDLVLLASLSKFTS